MPNVSRLLQLTLCVALAACSAQPKKHAAPAQPTAATPAPTVSTVDPQHYERDKERVRLTLAKNNHDALAAAEVGYYMDVLEGRVNQIAHVGVTRLGNRIVLDVAGRLDASNDPRVLETLDALSKVLAEYRTTLVSVRVVSDDSRSRNVTRLPEQDARVVVRRLIADGVSAGRIVVPAIDSPATPAGKASTRIELELEPIVRIDE